MQINQVIHTDQLNDHGPAVHWVGVRTIGDVKIRVTIKADTSYRHQGFYTAEAFNPATLSWSSIWRIDPNSMAQVPRLTDTRNPKWTTVDAFRAIDLELMRIARLIIED